MNFTLGFIVVILIVIFGVDLWLLITKDYRATVSATLLKLGEKYPIVVLLIGIVMGHIFWKNEAAVIEAVEECERKYNNHDGLRP